VLGLAFALGTLFFIGTYNHRSSKLEQSTENIELLAVSPEGVRVYKITDGKLIVPTVLAVSKDGSVALAR
jgi:hypothetical protein